VSDPVVVQPGDAPSAEVQNTDPVGVGVGPAPDDESGATRVGEEPEPLVPDRELTSVPAVKVEASPTLRAHPAAELFPMLGDQELAELAEDIRTRGLIEPLVTVEVDGEKVLLDGRNRLRACLMAGVEPSSVPWDGSGGSALGFVLARNLRRRHLTPSQRAAVAVERNHRPIPSRRPPSRRLPPSSPRGGGRCRDSGDGGRKQTRSGSLLSRPAAG
jgi:hypothetical protein